MAKRSKKKKDSEIPGSAYIITPSSEPDAFTPTTTGTFIPNFDELIEKSSGNNKGGTHIEHLYITPQINPIQSITLYRKRKTYLQ